MNEPTNTTAPTYNMINTRFSLKLYHFDFLSFQRMDPETEPILDHGKDKAADIEEGLICEFKFLIYQISANISKQIDNIMTQKSTKTERNSLLYLEMKE